MDKKIYIASDHAGFLAKEDICELLVEMGVNFENLGPDSEDSVDYPDYAKKVCTAVQADLDNSLGILICGSGTGMAIAANKFSGIRASFSYDVYSAKFARLDNNANVLTLRAREFDHSEYKEILKAFFENKFPGIERHQKRIDKVMSFEKL